MKRGCIIAIVIAVIFFVIILAIVGSVIGKYNSMQKLKVEVDNGWAEVENQLNRRYDLIPNLVETVKGYAAHESSVLTQVTESRSRVGSATTTNEKITANNELTSSLSRLLLVMENYPNLKANENFTRLQDELAGTENRLAVARQRYNTAVTELNKAIVVFPNNIIAGMFNIEKGVFFDAPAEANTVPQVRF